MMKMLTICHAEMRKSHRHNFNNRLMYFSLFLWPVIQFINAYYAFKPFNLGQNSPLSRFVPVEKLGLFLITGCLAYIFFWSLVQSAWMMGYERQQGTLELILLTPASRTLVMFSRAAANLVEAVWMFSIFAILTILFMGGLHIAHWWLLPFAVMVLLLSAVVWGGFLNTIFLFSRDAGFLYTIFEAPMEFFSGVRMPIMAFPIWAKVISFLFPLTFVLNILRAIVMDGKTLGSICIPLIELAIILIALTAASFILVRYAEKHAKDTGNLTFF
jgi:ABC-2 type transport system permease protein